VLERRRPFQPSDIDSGEGQMRSLSEQGVVELGGRTSVLTLQKRDHVNLDRLLHELAEVDLDRQGRQLRRIYRLVFPHAFAEEAVLWPVLRRVLPEGPALTLKIEQEHQEVNDLVVELENSPLNSPDRERLLDRLVQVLREDVRDEEDALLPRLQERVSRRQLGYLGACWEIVRRVAPTRAHPVVARRPPGNAVSAIPLSVIDRARDAVDALIERGTAAERLGPVSERLRQVAHWIEHLPPLTRGEHPSTSRSA
jgi:hypothetical protein